MIGRLRYRHRTPAVARRYQIAALLIGTAAAVIIGVGNALDAPEAGSGFEKEDPFGVLLVVV